MMVDLPRLTCSVPEAGEVIGVARKKAYELAAQGRIPTITIGRKLRVPLKALEEAIAKAAETGRL